MKRLLQPLLAITLVAMPLNAQSSAQKQPQQAEQQVSDLLRKIYDDGDLPKEWDSLSDREVELEIYKLTRRNGKPPDGWENWQKLLKLKPNWNSIQWFVEFTAKVKKEDFDEEVRRILDTHGGVLMHLTYDPLHRGFWIRMISEARAKQISQDPKVRRVEAVYPPKPWDRKSLAGCAGKSGGAGQSQTTPDGRYSVFIGFGLDSALAVFPSVPYSLFPSIPLFSKGAAPIKIAALLDVDTSNRVW